MLPGLGLVGVDARTGYNPSVRRSLALFLCLLCGCASTRPAAPDVGFVAPALGAMTGTTVAVLPFDNGTPVRGVDYLVADEFNLRLGMTNRFRLVERQRVQELYREQDFDPRRLEDSTAVRIGRMLGARAVLLGTVTHYNYADRPPEVPLDAFPILMPMETEEEVVIALVANTVAGLAAFLSMKQPVAEVGVSVRMVSTESGEILWQARNRYNGNDEFLTKRRPRGEWDRLRQDVVFLTSVLASDMVETLQGSPFAPPPVTAAGAEWAPEAVPKVDVGVPPPGGSPEKKE